MSLDDSSRDYFKVQLDQDIKSHQAFEDGWFIHVKRYDIPLPGDDVHTNIEFHGPQRDDGTHFYTSIDTNTFVDPETSWIVGVAHDTFSFSYVSGTEMRMTMDHNREGNWVVLDENQVQSEEVYSGLGPEAFLRFAQIAEQATEFNTSLADYVLLPDNDAPEDDNRANSNAGPIQILENLEYDVTDLRHEDLPDGFTAPGANHRISSLFPQKEPGYFERMKPEQAAALLDPNSEAYKRFIYMMEQLHPDVILERGVDNPVPPYTNGFSLGTALPKQ